MLSFAIAASAFSPAEHSFLQEQSPTICDPAVKQYSGYYKLTTGNKKCAQPMPFSCCLTYTGVVSALCLPVLV